MVDKLIKYKTTLVYFPLAIYWAFIFTLTTLPSDSIPANTINDKVSHFLAFFGLSFLLSLTLKIQDKFPVLKKKHIFFTLMICIIYAAVDELHQMLVPGRLADILDWTADSIGSFFGLLASYLLFLKRIIIKS